MEGRVFRVIPVVAGRVRRTVRKCKRKKILSQYYKQFHLTGLPKKSVILDLFLLC